MREPARTALAENVLLVQHITRGDRLQRVLSAPDERATGVREQATQPEGSSAGGDTPAQGERRDAHGPGGVPHPNRGG